MLVICLVTEKKFTYIYVFMFFIVQRYTKCPKHQTFFKYFIAINVKT